MTLFLVGLGIGAPVGGLLVAYAWLRSDGSSVRRPGYVDLTPRSGPPMPGEFPPPSRYDVRSLTDTSVPEGVPGHVRAEITFRDPPRGGQ